MNLILLFAFHTHSVCLVAIQCMRFFWVLFMCVSVGFLFVWRASSQEAAALLRFCQKRDDSKIVFASVISMAECCVHTHSSGS